MDEPLHVDVHLDGYGGFIEMAKDFALVTSKDGEMLPTLLIWDGAVGHAKVAFVLIPFSKEREKLMAAMLMGQIRKDGVPYIFITEAWMATTAEVQPRDNPDRKECLTIQGVDKDGNAHCFIASIDGPEDDRTFGEWEDFSEGTGRFTGPLGPSLTEIDEAIKTDTLDDLDKREREKAKMERATNRQDARSN